MDTENEFKDQIEHFKASQAGSDREVNRLKGVIEDLTGQLSEAKTGKKPDLLRDKEQQLDRKMKLLDVAKDSNYDPGLLFTLFGLDDSDDDARLNALGEYSESLQQQTKTDILKEYGRNPSKPKLDMTPLSSLEQINQLTDREIAMLPGDTVKNALDQYGRVQRGQPRNVKESILQNIARGNS